MSCRQQGEYLHEWIRAVTVLNSSRLNLPEIKEITHENNCRYLKN
jgi:hypothetical protein